MLNKLCFLVGIVISVGGFGFFKVDGSVVYIIGLFLFIGWEFNFYDIYFFVDVDGNFCIYYFVKGLFWIIDF